MTAGLARIRSVDVLRGVIMVLMAIDHVRVYAGVPAGGLAPAVFFTRWVTHFCAPGFVFLAGTSAYLHGERLAGTRQLSQSLLLRGLMLVLLELTVMRLAWTFNLDFYDYNLAGVLWMIGCSMVWLSAMVWLPTQVIVAIALTIIAAHNSIDLSSIETVAGTRFQWVAQLAYLGGSFRIGDAGPRLVILYSLIPWLGVIAAGYGFGRVLRFDPTRRRLACLAIGGSAIALFVVLRTFNIYGDPRPWNPQQPLTYLNTVKYPASLLFLLMTLGPMIIAVPMVEGARGRIASALEILGRAPLFYYLLHIPLIHLAAVMVSVVRTGSITPWLFGNFPMEPSPQPPGYRWSLGLMYAVTGFVVIVLFLACRWYDARRVAARQEAR